MSMLGTLWIVSAPSGGGNTSLIKALLSNLTDIKVSVSHSTRAPRTGEVEGQHYFFTDEATFKSQQGQGAFLETAKVFNAWYGTSQQWVMAQLQAGIDVVLDIDWQGANSIRSKMPWQSIFILPTCEQVLQKRLTDRRQDPPDVIAARMAQARSEMSHYSEYDYVVINDEFTEATTALSAIVLANRLKSSQQQQRHQALIAQLMRRT